MSTTDPGTLEKIAPALPGRVATSPHDAYNRELVRNVHPLRWRNPAPAKRYDLVVIGAGTAGLVAAAEAAGLGARVALVERDLMGGDSLNVGSVPSKALLRSARAAAEARRLSELGVEVGEPRVDFAKVMARVRRLRARLSGQDSVQRFRDLGVDVFLGDAAFTAPDCIAVGDHTLRFRRACLATGARPIVPPIDGLEAVDVLTNESVFSLTELPERLAVLGGGPLGCELAQAFARLGSRVTLIQLPDQLLTREDADVAQRVRQALEATGVEVFLGAQLSSVQPAGGERVVLELTGTDLRATRAVDTLLVAVGRRADVEDLGLAAAGIALDSQGKVLVDETLRTTNKRVFAAGDVCLDHQFTHAADASARLVVRNALFPGRRKLDRATIPWCTYTDPEVARVGLNRREAAASGQAIDAYRVEFNDVDRAVIDGDEGWLEVLTRKGSDNVVGATIVAPHGGELLPLFSAAVSGAFGLRDCAGMVLPYPTRAEAIKKAIDAQQRQRSTPWRKLLLSGLRALVR